LKEQIRGLQEGSKKTEGMLISQIHDLKAEFVRFQGQTEVLTEAAK
jgi:hypothetical protein